jgi:predicted GIY-YIG superfamily endonuclease
MDGKTTNIYILRLAKGKYYVGKTNDVQKRYAEHLRGKGAEWTRIYRPLNIQTIIYDTSPFDEDRYVKEYMSKFGVDSVRGGSYSQTVLDDAQKSAIEKELRAAEDTCIRCGRAGHFVAACYARTDVDGCVIDEEESEEEDDDDACHRCGRGGHWMNECYARRHVDGWAL